ncbi:unnamed protein product, partial [Prorocentrum cordatum]
SPFGRRPLWLESSGARGLRVLCVAPRWAGAPGRRRPDPVRGNDIGGQRCPPPPSGGRALMGPQRPTRRAAPLLLGALCAAAAARALGALRGARAGPAAGAGEALRRRLSGAWRARPAPATDVPPEALPPARVIRGHLSRSLFFRCLGREEMDVVIRAMRSRVVQPCESIISRGAKGDSMFLVVSGAFDCMVPINGTDAVVKMVRAGDIVGELAILYDRPRAASVVCRKRAMVLELDGDVFWAVVKRSPKQWKMVVRTIFDFFDSDKSGQIDKEEVRLAMRSLGATLSEKELANFMKQHDRDGNGEIDLLEFSNMLDDLPSRHAYPDDTATSKDVI